MFWAYPDNKLARFKKLLEHGADPNVRLTSNLGHPRIFARNESLVTLTARSWFEGYFEAVMEHGGDPEQKNFLGERALDSVIATGGENVISRVDLILDSGVDIDSIGWGGCTPIMNAVVSRRFDLALHLWNAEQIPGSMQAKQIVS